MGGTDRNEKYPSRCSVDFTRRVLYSDIYSRKTVLDEVSFVLGLEIYRMLWMYYTCGSGGCWQKGVRIVNRRSESRRNGFYAKEVQRCDKKSMKKGLFYQRIIDKKGTSITYFIFIVKWGRTWIKKDVLKTGEYILTDK